MFAGVVFGFGICVVCAGCLGWRLYVVCDCCFLVCVVLLTLVWCW